MVLYTLMGANGIAPKGTPRSNGMHLMTPGEGGVCQEGNKLQVDKVSISLTGKHPSNTYVISIPGS